MRTGQRTGGGPRIALHILERVHRQTLQYYRQTGIWVNRPAWLAFPCRSAELIGAGKAMRASERRYNAAMDSRPGLIFILRFICFQLLLFSPMLAPQGLAAPAAQTAPDNDPVLTAEQSRAIVGAAWEGVRDRFYDPQFRGVDWDAVHAQYVQRAAAVHDRDQAVALVREMIGLLHNSHSGVMTHAELDWTQNVLPFFFDRVDGRTFVSYVFERRGDGTDAGVRFGDEIVSVDGQAAARLEMPSVNWLTPVLSDPYYGAAGSAATLVVRQDGRTLTVKVKRVRRWNGIEPVFAEQYGPVGYVRLLTMGSAAIPAEMLRRAMDKVDGSGGMILDLRECVGGDAPVADGLGGILMGTGVKLATRVTRAGTETVEKTGDFGPVYKGRVVVLVDGQTASEPEMLTAALKEYGRVTVVGERTRGAFNGSTEGIALPDHAGILVVPIDRGISPQGKEYEGVGVTPDVAVKNSIRDFRTGRDRAMETALRLAAH